MTNKEWDITNRIKQIEKKAKEIQKQRNRERLNAELKPCPFCGGKAVILNRTENDGHIHYNTVLVACLSCYASTQAKICDGYYEEYCTDEEIAELWNRRVDG